jgi:hypothetical protein
MRNLIDQNGRCFRISAQNDRMWEVNFFLEVLVRWCGFVQSIVKCQTAHIGEAPIPHHRSQFVGIEDNATLVASRIPEGTRRISIKICRLTSTDPFSPEASTEIAARNLSMLRRSSLTVGDDQTGP